MIDNKKKRNTNIMNTQQLKKGDRFTSEFGDGVIIGCDSLAVYGVLDDGTKFCTNPIFLTRIPTHAERMQKIVDAAFDAENRLEDDETVQFRVGDMAEFVRHYLVIANELAEQINADKHLAGQLIEAAQLSEKTLKGEL